MTRFSSKWILSYSTWYKFSRSGQEPQNTTISAVISVVRIQPHYLQLLDLVRENPRRDLAEYEVEIRGRIPDYDSAFEVPRVIVWHNAVARIPFPSGLFRGPYDTHFGIVHVADGEVEQDVTYEGTEVPDRLKLFKPRKQDNTP